MSGIDVDTMISELQDHIGVQPTDPDWTTDDCLLLLNRSFWEILNKFNFREKELEYPMQFTQGVYEYTMPMNTESIQSIGCQDPFTNKSHKLRRIGINVLQNVFDPNPIFQREPTSYLRRDTYNIKIWPIPDKTYNGYVFYLINLADLVDGGTVDIPREWDELILLGGIWRGYFKVGDMDRANQTKNFQAGLINTTVPVESKEETDSPEGPGLGLGYAGVNAPGYRRGPNNGGYYRLWR